MRIVVGEHITPVLCTLWLIRILGSLVGIVFKREISQFILYDGKVYKMTEIPVADSGGQDGRSFEVTIATILLIVNAILGLVMAALGLEWSGDALSAIGFLVAAAALWVARGLWNLEEWSWNWAVMLNIVGAVLYLFSIVWLEGLIICGISLFYLNLPNVKKHFVTSF
jgi:hypothetical protein